MNFNNVSVLVPFNTDAGNRELNWMWIKERYKLLMPGAEICIGTSNIIPYCKSQAINNAAKMATRDIFIITDADITFDIEDIEKALDLLQLYKWVIPYSKLIKFNNDLTKIIISNPYDIILKNLSLNESNSQVYFDASIPNCYQLVGGIQIIEKINFIKCGGFDERFRGWGREDDAFAHIAKYLFEKVTRPANMTVYHLYHENQTPDKSSLDKNSILLKENYTNKKNLNQTINYLKLNNKLI